MTENDPPAAIRHFETLQLGSLLIGLMHQFAISADGFFETLLGAAVLLWLTLSVSRRRKTWARWLLLAAFLFGAAMTAWLTPLAPKAGYPLLTLVIWLAQAVALGLLFTRRATDWLRPGAALIERSQPGSPR